MTQPTNTEDWDDSMEKCEAISKLIPMLYDSIHQIRALDQKFERNIHLKGAEQLFRPLSAVKHLTITEEKMSYVQAYRECLTKGIEHLTHFFNELKNELQSMNNKNQGEFGRLSANIFMAQESIVDIATH